MKNFQLTGAAYQHVELLPSGFKQQRDHIVELYLNTPATDDILHPLRKKAGLPSQAKGLPGWGPSIGQYMAAYAKLYRNTGDQRIYDKCMAVFHGWVECVEANDQVLTNGTYMFDKILGGLVDMYEHMGVHEVKDYALRLTRRAQETYDTSIPRDGLQDGRMKGQIEWYTMPENLYRAYQLFGDAIYKEMADEWIYHYMWGKLVKGEKDIGPRHAYSQVNSLSSAAQAYIVTEDPFYLDVIEKGYKEITENHTYATGGYGPAETLFGAVEGYLGNALLTTWDKHYKGGEGIVYKNFGGGMVARSDAWGSCEVSCCAWAVFKLCNYLLQLTGDARYGDWAERMLINGTLGQPPITEKGQVLYYASYFADGAIKSYDDRRLQWLGQNFVWQCCTGTFPNDVAEYANMVAYFDEEGVRISQLIPAKITFEHKGQGVTVISDADFPAKPMAHMTVKVEKPTAFALRLRVPAWAKNGNTVKVNGEVLDLPCQPNTWLTIDRQWNDGDQVQVDMPYALSFKAVDPQHPDLVALLWGPMVLACDEMTILVGDREKPEEWIKPVEGEENVFETLPGHSGVYDFIVRRFRPYYTIGLMQWYYMYNYIYPDMEAVRQFHQGM